MGNILNLVFEKWDGDKELPNLSEINQYIGGDYIIEPHILVNLPNPFIKINKCKFEDITNDENYYYIICHRCSFESMFNEDGWAISEDTEEQIKKNNLKVIFLSEHESFKNLQKSISILKSLINKKKLKETQFYIINNNSLLYDIKSQLDTGINVFKINFLLESVSESITVRTRQSLLKTDKRFLFLCQNRRPKNHRLALLTLLKNKDILKDDIIDWSLTYGNMNQSFTELTKYQFYINFDNIKLFNDYKEIISKPKLSFYEQDVNWWNHENDYQAWNHLDLTTFNESYINIITESHFDIEDIHLTEKTFKPFYYFQLPIFLGSYHHIKKLKAEHDLFLFDDFINHSYDDEKDNVKRMNMVIDEIIRLSSMRNEIENYYKSNISKLIHNHRYIRDFHLKNQTNLYFLGLIKKKII